MRKTTVAKETEINKCYAHEQNELKITTVFDHQIKIVK